MNQPTPEQQLTAESPEVSLQLVVTHTYQAKPEHYLDKDETTTVGQMAEVDFTNFAEDPDSLFEDLSTHWDQCTVAVLTPRYAIPTLVIRPDLELSPEELEKLTQELDRAMEGPHRLVFADDQVTVEAPRSPSVEMVRWLASLENSPERATVTLQQIIDRARTLLSQQDTFAALSAATDAALHTRRLTSLKNVMEDGSEAEPR